MGDSESFGIAPKASRCLILFWIVLALMRLAGNPALCQSMRCQPRMTDLNVVAACHLTLPRDLRYERLLAVLSQRSSVLGADCR